MKSIIAAFFLFISQKFLAQVDEPKMRQECQGAIVKIQPSGNITQRATILSDKQTTVPISNRYFDIFRDQTELLVSKEDFNRSSGYFRNKPIGNSIFIDDVQFSSFILSNGAQWADLFDPLSIHRGEIYYGQTLIKYDERSEAQIALYHPTRFDLKSIGNQEVKTGVFVSQNNISPRVSYIKKWSRTTLNIQNFAHIDMRYPNHTQPNARPYELSKLNYFYSSQLQLNTILTKERELQFFVKLFSGHSEMLGRGFWIDTSIKSTNGTWANSPSLISYLQYSKTSEDNLFYTKMKASVSYQYLNSEQYEIIQNQTLTSQLLEHKLQFQTNFVKELNARHAFYFGTVMANTWLQGVTSPILSFRQANYSSQPEISGYFRHERRMSSDASWFWGIRSGLSTRLIGDSIATRKRIVVPNLRANISWTRHSCEGSNYSVNLYANLYQPALDHIQPQLVPIIFQPNFNLKPTKELLLEGNIYRMFGTIVEIHISPYIRISQDALAVKENTEDSAMDLSWNNEKYKSFQNHNLTSLQTIGFNSELKIHFSKSWMYFMNIAHNQNVTDVPSSFFVQNNRAYGQAGLKFRSKNFSAQVWTVYRQGRNTAEKIPDRFQSFMSLNSYTTFHISAFANELTKKIALGARIDNILDSYSHNYLSPLLESKRSWSMWVQFKI